MGAVYRAVDLRFRNDNPTGVLIQTAWTPTSITVRMYGTKRYEVTSTPGPRTNPTQPQTVTIPKGKPCSPTQGGPGFTITWHASLLPFGPPTMSSKSCSGSSGGSISSPPASTST